MSAKPPAEEPAKAPAKSKKMLIIIVGVVLTLLLGGGGAFMYIAKQRAAAAAEDEEGAAPAHVEDKHKVPPVYLPLDNMVVNLADPGGERVAQIGITLQVRDAQASDKVKVYLPAIRSGVLLVISQRTAEELLSQEGKQSLAKAILKETSIPFGGGEEEPPEEEEAPKAKGKKAKKAPAPPEYPVVGVLFSSFIVQ